MSTLFQTKAVCSVFLISFVHINDFLRPDKIRKGGSTTYQPVLFDMDPCGGKEILQTKYQESGTPSSLINTILTFDKDTIIFLFRATCRKKCPRQWYPHLKNDKIQWEPAF